MVLWLHLLNLLLPPSLETARSSPFFVTISLEISGLIYPDLRLMKLLDVLLGV
jgi:hypothetical protein